MVTPSPESSSPTSSSHDHHERGPAPLGLAMGKERLASPPNDHCPLRPRGLVAPGRHAQRMLCSCVVRDRHRLIRSAVVEVIGGTST